MPELEFVIILSFTFMFSEILLAISKRIRTKDEREKYDRGSLLLIWCTITLSMTIAFFLSYKGKWNTANYLVGLAGLVTAIAGFIIRWGAVIKLRDSFTVSVSVQKNQEIVTTGIYAYIRHPSYLGLLLIIAGLSLCMNSVLSVVSLLVPVFIAILYRISVEEKLLVLHFGDKYLEYSKNTNRLIPWLW
jgi:protein-S-isoprenylcysteine O-methyltransferase Ste14